MFDIGALKNVGDLTTSEKSDFFGKLLSNKKNTLSERECSQNKLALRFEMDQNTQLHHATTNTATTTSSAIRLNVRHSNCDGGTVPRNNYDVK